MCVCVFVLKLFLEFETAEQEVQDLHEILDFLNTYSGKEGFFREKTATTPGSFCWYRLSGKTETQYTQQEYHPTICRYIQSNTKCHDPTSDPIQDPKATAKRSL